MTLNVKFASDVYTGSGVANEGTAWNVISPDYGKLPSPKDSYGTTVSSVEAYVYPTKGPTDASPAGNEPARMFGSGFAAECYFGIHGLNPGRAYDLYVYVSNPYKQSSTVILTSLTTLQASTEASNITEEFAPNKNYVVFANVFPKKGEDLRVTLTTAGAILNGFQIVERTASPTPTPTPAPTAAPSPTPAAPPAVAFRTSGTISSHGRPVTLRGTAESPVGIRQVQYSLNRKAWRKARGAEKWSFTVAAKKRTRVFVRAQDVNGRFSTVEAATIVPRIRF